MVGSRLGPERLELGFAAGQLLLIVGNLLRKVAALRFPTLGLARQSCLPLVNDRVQPGTLRLLLSQIATQICQRGRLPGE